LLALAVGITVFSAGITTSAFAYLASERLLRAAAARALATRVPDRRVVPGVTAEPSCRGRSGPAFPPSG